MQWQSTPYVLLLFIAAAAAGVWTVYGAKTYRDEGRSETAYWFVVLCAAVFVWCGMYAIQLSAPTLDGKLRAYKLLHVGGVAAPAAWFSFAICYSGREALLTRQTIAGIWSIPIALLVALPTNPYSLALTDVSVVTEGSLQVLVTENGPLYLLHLAYSYVIIVIGAVLIVVYALDSGEGIRRQVALVIAGAIIPLGLNVLQVFSVPPLDVVPVNLTPISLSLSAVLFGVAVFRYRILDLTPIAAGVVLSQMNDGVIILDTDDRILRMNPAAEALLGDEEELHGQEITTHFAPFSDAVETLDTGPVLAQLEDVDTDRFLRINRSELVADGEVYGSVVLIQDVTDIEVQRQELVAQNERLDAFTKAISHDLRNQLTVIDGYSELAYETGERSHVDKVHATIESVIDFLEDLLELSRRGETVRDLEPVPLTAIIEDVTRSVSTNDLTVTVESEMTVVTDRGRLQQVIDNLVRNALENAENGVNVAFGRTPNGFFIEDDGPGIAPENRERVFEIGVTTRPNGTGFGLPIVRDIVEAHGWTIEVTEARTGGARFEIEGVEFDETPTNERRRRMCS